jgi:hypothetical protein
LEHYDARGATIIDDGCAFFVLKEVRGHRLTAVNAVNLGEIVTLVQSLWANGRKSRQQRRSAISGRLIGFAPLMTFFSRGSLR